MPFGGRHRQRLPDPTSWADGTSCDEPARSGAPHGASGRRGTGDAPGRLRREGRGSRTLCEARAGRGPNFPAPSRASHPCRGASLRRSVASASPPARLRRSVGRAASGPLADNRGYRPRSGGSPAALRCAGAPLPPPGPACGRTFDITSERYVKPPGASGARSIARSLKGLATSLANAPPHAPLVLARCAPPVSYTHLTLPTSDLV